MTVSADALHIVCPHCHTTNRVRVADLHNAPDCGQCHQALFAGHPLALDAASFDKHIGRNQIPVLVDFWASWCAPCRVANKSLVKMYPRLKEKGVVVISISLDENRKSWVEAVKKDRLGWLQVREVRGWYSSVTTDWAVNKIPSTFLVDQEGNIV